MNDELNVMTKPNDQLNNMGGEFTVPVDIPAAPVDIPAAPVDIPAVPVDIPAVPVDMSTVPMDVTPVPVDMAAVPMDIPSVPVEPVEPQVMNQDGIINPSALTSDFNNVSQAAPMETNQMNVNPAPVGMDPNQMNMNPNVAIGPDPVKSIEALNPVANMIENPMYDATANFKSTEDVLDRVNMNPVDEEEDDGSSKGALIKIFLIGVILLAFIIVLPTIA